ncbi:MAG: response regulator [Fibrobacter sp.]|nr:response regulator [Fibrobacter sp.]
MSSKIVVVDDLPLTLDFIRFHLELAGYSNIITLESPLEALRYLQFEAPVFAIISDFEMPGMNGLEFLNKTRTFHPRTPAIIATCDPDSAIEAKEYYPVLDKSTDSFIPELKIFLSAAVSTTTTASCM